MVQAEVYERIEYICGILQDKKNTTEESVIDLLYNELEILCEIIQADRKLNDII